MTGIMRRDDGHLPIHARGAEASLAKTLPKGRSPPRATTRAACLAAALIAGVAAAAPGEPLRPAWVTPIPGGVEWCALAPADFSLDVAAADSRARGSQAGGAADAILVGTRDARVLVLDASSGRALFERAMETGPGARLGSLADGRAFLLDRFVVYAVATRAAAASTPDGLIWRAGVWPPGATRPAGDPEFMTRLVAAAASEAGVVAARSDGRVALLDARDGGVVWSLAFPPLNECRVHACGGLAAVVWKEGMTMQAARLDLRAAHPQPRRTTLGTGVPLHTSLMPTGLAAVWIDRLAWLGADADAPRVTILRRPARSDCVAMVASKESGASVWIGSAAGGLDAYDAQSGEHDHLDDLAPFELLWMRCVDGRVLASGRADVVALDAVRRRRCAVVAAPPGETIVDAAVHRGRLVAVASGRDGGPGAPLRLLRSNMEAAGTQPNGATTRAAGAAAGADPRGPVLLEARDFRSVHWVDGRVVIAEEGRILAYEFD